LKINRAIIGAVAVLLVVGAAVSGHIEDSGSEQAASDRQLVDCLTKQLTYEEKRKLAQLASVHDSDSIRFFFTAMIPHCIVRDDQRERAGALIVSARQVLRSDPDFQRMVMAASIAPVRQ